MAKLGSIPKLRLVSFTPRPALSTLTQAQQLQLEERGRPWNLSAADMLAEDGERELNLIVIASEEGAQFDAWLNEGNEGSIFRAGTTEEVAWMSQGGIPECEDKALLTALRDALAGRHLNALREANSPRGEPANRRSREANSPRGEPANRRSREANSPRGEPANRRSREANSPGGGEGPWAAYRAACERSDDGGSNAVVSDSFESEEDVPF